MDFLPARRSKSGQSDETEMQVAEEGGFRGDGAADSERYFRGAPASGVANGYTNGHTNGHANGNGYVSHEANGYPKPATPPVASRNF